MKLLVRNEDNQVIGTVSSDKNPEILPEDRRMVDAQDTEIQKFLQRSEEEKYLKKMYYWDPESKKVFAEVVNDRRNVKGEEIENLKKMVESDPEKVLKKVLDLIEKLEKGRFS